MPARCSAVPVHGVLVIGQGRVEARPREGFRGKKKKKTKERKEKEKRNSLKFSNNAGLCEND